MSLPWSRALKKASNCAWVGVIGNVAGIHHLHGQRAPGALLVPRSAEWNLYPAGCLAADEVRVEIVRLASSQSRTLHLAGGAVLELEDVDARARIFVGRKQLALRAGVVAHDFDDLAAHAEQQGVHGVAAGFEQGAAALALAPAPAELGIPGADAVDSNPPRRSCKWPQQPAVQDSLDDLELARVAALETDAGLDFGLLDGLMHGRSSLVRDQSGFSRNQMLAGTRGANNLVQPLGRKAAQRDDVYVGIGEQLIQVVIDR